MCDLLIPVRGCSEWVNLVRVVQPAMHYVSGLYFSAVRLEAWWYISPVWRVCHSLQSRFHWRRTYWMPTMYTQDLKKLVIKIVKALTNETSKGSLVYSINSPLKRAEHYTGIKSSTLRMWIRLWRMKQLRVDPDWKGQASCFTSCNSRGQETGAPRQEHSFRRRPLEAQNRLLLELTYPTCIMCAFVFSAQNSQLNQSF